VLPFVPGPSQHAREREDFAAIGHVAPPRFFMCPTLGEIAVQRQYDCGNTVQRTVRGRGAVTR
jgi:hypothetical protein